MPTNTPTYNSRVTDENLEKKFRETFKSQAGAELINDLYAQGTIVPVVDFTDAAIGSVLRQNLQEAWDFSTTRTKVNAGSGTTSVLSTPGFYKVGVSMTLDYAFNNQGGSLQLNDGATTKIIWAVTENLSNPAEVFSVVTEYLTVFLRTGDSLEISVGSATDANVWYRQIADVYGSLKNPLGFTSQ